MCNIYVNTSVYVEIRDINEDRHVIPLNNKSHPHPLISSYRCILKLWIVFGKQL